jgi:hypothetical protein
MARKKKGPTPAFPELEAHRHQDTRTNIPTEELRDLVANDEAKPKTMLYPRDPSLDPQLVWKDKDEQDRQPLEVEIVPIYIQEVIEYRVIVEAVQARKTTKPDNVSHIAGDSGWEFKLEQELEGMAEVIAYLKNQNLGLTIPTQSTTLSAGITPSSLLKSTTITGRTIPSTSSLK